MKKSYLLPLILLLSLTYIPFTAHAECTTYNDGSRDPTTGSLCISLSKSAPPQQSTTPGSSVGVETQSPPTGSTQSPATDQNTSNGATSVGQQVTPMSAQPTNTSSGACPNGGQPGPSGGCNLGYTPLEPIPGVTTGFDITNPANLPVLINAVFKILFTIGALMAVVMLVWAASNIW